MTDEVRIDQHNARLAALEMAQKAFLGTVCEPMPSTDAVLERAESYLAFLTTGRAPVSDKTGT